MATYHDSSDIRPFVTCLTGVPKQNLRRLETTRPLPLSQAAQRQEDTSIVLTSSGYSGCIPFCKRKAIRVADIEMRVLHLESRVEDVPSREQVSELCTSAEDQDRRIRDLQVFASNTERDLQASISSTKAQFDGLQASVDIQIGGVIKTSKSVCESVGQCEQLSSSFKQEILSRLDNVEGCLTKLKEKVESQVQ